MVKSVCNVTEFTKPMLYNYIKVVRLTPDQPNQWLQACTGLFEHIDDILSLHFLSYSDCGSFAELVCDYYILTYICTSMLFVVSF